MAWLPLDRRRRQRIASVWALWISRIVTCAAASNQSSVQAQVAHAFVAIVKESSSPALSSLSANATGTTAINHNDLHPHVATYRNGYGTQFQCEAACYFTMVAYLVSVAGVLTLFAVIPVQSPTNPEHAPFLLWFNNASHQEQIIRKDPSSQHIYHATVAMHDKEEDDSFPEKKCEESPETAIERDEIIKTFETIGVETDDSLFPPLPTPPGSLHTGDCMLIDDVDKLFDPLPLPSPSKKPGIFSPASQKPIVANRPSASDFGASATSMASEPSASGRQRAASLARRPLGSTTTSTMSSGRRATMIGGQTSENLLVAVERNMSMQKRADKRKEHAKSDITHDTLHAQELHMYEYLEFIRELLEGTSIKKVCQKSAKIVKRTFFITPDLSTVYWNKLATKSWPTKKSSLETANIDRVTKGITGSANLQSKGKQDKQELYVSVVMKGGKQLDLEAKDAATARRLFVGFSQLATEKREELDKKNKPKRDVAAVETQPDAVARPGEEERPSIDQQQAKAEESDPEQWGQELHPALGVTDHDGEEQKEGEREE